MGNIYDIEPGLFYLFFKKHYCLKCGNKLLRRKVEEEISRSDATNIRNEYLMKYDIQMGGDEIKKIHYEFKCNQCNTNYTIEEMKKIGI